MASLDPAAVLEDLFERAEGESPSASEPRKAPRPRRKVATSRKGRGGHFLSDREVAARFGVSRATIWRWVAKKAGFPEPVKLSPGTSRWRIEDLWAFEKTAAVQRRKTVKGRRAEATPLGREGRA